MLEKTRQQIVEETVEFTEEFPLYRIILENVIFWFMILLGALGFYQIRVQGFDYPIFTFIFLGYSLYMLLYHLRKKSCIHCYYYGKNCHLGWGKLASRFYSKGDPEEFMRDEASFQSYWDYWGTKAPIIAMVASLIFAFNYWMLTNLLFFVGLNFFMMKYFGKYVCIHCKMRGVCFFARRILGESIA